MARLSEKTRKRQKEPEKNNIQREETKMPCATHDRSPGEARSTTNNTQQKKNAHLVRCFKSFLLNV